MISLADLRARSVAPTWQEAVAVVQELVQTVIASGGALDRLPDLEHVALIPNGDVVVLPGGPIPEQPVRHLGTMLAALLEGANAPGELTAFVEGSLAWPPQFETPEEFSKQLAFFERPGRQQDVERLVSRALASEAQTRTDEELRRLKERTAEAAERSALDETVMMERPRQRSRLPVAIAAAIAVVGIAGAVLYRASIARHERQAAAQAQAAAGTLSRAGGQTPGGGSVHECGTDPRAGGRPRVGDRLRVRDSLRLRRRARLRRRSRHPSSPARRARSGRRSRPSSDRPQRRNPQPSPSPRLVPMRPNRRRSRNRITRRLLPRWPLLPPSRRRPKLLREASR